MVAPNPLQYSKQHLGAAASKERLGVQSAPRVRIPPSVGNKPKPAPQAGFGVQAAIAAPDRSEPLFETAHDLREVLERRRLLVEQRLIRTPPKRISGVAVALELESEALQVLVRHLLQVLVLLLEVV